MLDRPTVVRNIAQQGDALALLCALPHACTPLAFLDPQHRAVLDKLKFGNEGTRQRGRAALPAMTEKQPGDVVVDPAAGSFVAMHAAHQLERNFIGCDIVGVGR